MDNMNKPLNVNYAHYRSRLGSIFVASIDGRITDLSIGADKAAFLKRLSSKYRLAIPIRAEDSTRFTSVFKMLDKYFKGQPVTFDLPIKASGTPFKESVWEAVKEIRWGETRSYAWVASRINLVKAARAVGNACGANPIPIIIPCHRVLRSDGSAGGYTGGVDIKKALLNIEGIYL